MPRDRTIAAPPPEPAVNPRSQIMKEYAIRQRARGHTQVKLWVPEVMTDWLHKIASEARKLQEVGLDPTAHLPPTILPTSAGVRK